MPKTKNQKTETLAKLKENIAKMKSVVFVNFFGIPVKEINQLRNEARVKGVNYVVVKKTLLKKSLAEGGFKDIENKNFEGEVAAVFGFQDEVAPAKLVKDFAKGHTTMKILGGILDKNIMSDNEIKALADLPTREELLAKVVGTIAAPMSGFLNVLSGNLRGLVVVLNAIAKKKS